MNEKFYCLPEEKRQAILNAGYRVFSQNSYGKSPMRDIAEAAGISKALLFHYFHNKKELYLFLWETCGKLTSEYLERYGCYEGQDFFERMRRGLQAKVQLMKRYPYCAAFAAKAFYEKDPAVCGEIQASYRERVAFQTNAPRLELSPEQFIPELDVELMYREMCWAAEGYLWEKLQRGKLDAEEIDRDFQKLIGFWKAVYGRKEQEDGKVV